MADQENNDNNTAAPEDKQEANPVGEEQAAGKPLWMKIAIPAVALLIVGAGAFFFLAGGSESPAEKPKVEQVTEKDRGEVKTAYYLAFAKDFEVNLKNGSEDTRKHFMRIAITLMSYDEKFIEQVKNREPMIRADLLELYGSYTYDDLLHHRGKQKLRNDSKKLIENILEKENMAQKLESVLVTQFVME